MKYKLCLHIILCYYYSKELNSIKFLCDTILQNRLTLTLKYPKLFNLIGYQIQTQQNFFVLLWVL